MSNRPIEPRSTCPGTTTIITITTLTCTGTIFSEACCDTGYWSVRRDMHLH